MHRATRHFRLAPLLIIAFGSNSWPAATAAEHQLPVCQLIATGGTIAMKVDAIKNAPVPALSGEDLVASVPELANVANFRVESPFNIPSDYMDPERWVAIHERVEEALARDTDDLTPWPRTLTVDEIGEIDVSFPHPRQGRGYGVQWAPRV